MGSRSLSPGSFFVPSGILPAHLASPFLRSTRGVSSSRRATVMSWSSLRASLTFSDGVYAARFSKQQYVVWLVSRRPTVVETGRCVTRSNSSRRSNRSCLMMLWLELSKPYDASKQSKERNRLQLVRPLRPRARSALKVLSRGPRSRAIVTRRVQPLPTVPLVTALPRAVPLAQTLRLRSGMVRGGTRAVRSEFVFCR